ncbi:tyrosine-type recombinase/integrase [Bradyrhizobium cytisi]|uniref:tyrosine-type recombinase/integrase n=1 Tax=Bradyrhizobium cytisi TaxID=515489 RepID=UPI0016531F86|nr:tyrosine-type recombinase/integrase [Bradyrhizobium cytisi]
MSSLKSRTALAMVYATGVMASELADWRIEHIETPAALSRCVKCANDRKVMLSPRRLCILSTYWRLAQSRTLSGSWTRRQSTDPSDRVARRLAAAVKAADLTKRVTIHTLRHSFATHLHENGTAPISQILLRRNNVPPTARYAQVAIGAIRAT